MSTSSVHSTPPVNDIQPAVPGASSEGQNESAHTQQPTRQQTTAPPMPEKGNKEDQGRFFSIPRYQPTYTGGRSYNYEEKYAPDSLGEEFSDNARVWKVYLDEAENYDDDMLKGFRDTIDSLLVFAALFSAVVTTFVIKTIEALEPDFGQITAQVTATFMQEQIQILRAAGNITAINIIPSSTINLDGVPASSKDLWINGLFFASLSLSLATALISVLVKQWLQAYTSLSSGNAKERAMIRQFRFSGFENWGMQGIIGGLPLILHASLGLFLVGLALYVSQLHSSLCWIVVVITLLSFIMYFGSIILPLIWIKCPYRIPILFMLLRYIVSFSLSVWRKVHTNIETDSNNESQESLPYSLKDTELQYLRKGDNRHYVLADSLHWLCTLESNKSIQRIATQTLNGIFHTAHEYNQSHVFNDPTIPIYVVKLDFPLMARIAWDSFGNTENTYDNQIWPSLISLWYKILPDYDSGAKFQLVKECQPSLWDAAYKGHLGVIKFLIEKGADVNAVGGFYGTALQAAASQGHLDVVKFLVEKGADVNAVGGEYGTALQAAASQRHLDVVKFLHEKGADVNAVGGYFGTALLAVAFLGHLDVVKLLVEKGADVNAVGGEYGTALEAAQKGNEYHIAEFLQSKGARK
ncbi:hypothetical protein VKT23_010610 [Stygiomarasmius scandens]|uniref:DUF6535 domain-containing protein n=1 Tax=Marasmiellus scandens TaxID=2682957 RepID=A0ABR1JGG4_9AGAR